MFNPSPERLVVWDLDYHNPDVSLIWPHSQGFETGSHIVVPTCPHTILDGFFDLSQRTPLHMAARKGYKYTTECLVKAGAHINIKDNDGVCAMVH